MRVVVALCLVLTGCFSPSTPTGLPCSASGECPKGQVCTPQNTCEPPRSDAPAADAPTDALLLDACTNCPSLVAHYRFDDSLDDTSEAYPGAMVGGSPTYVTGLDGRALRIPASAAAYVRVENSPAFDLPSGRIELQFQFDDAAPAGDLGLLSRDAVGSALDGHFNLRLGHDRRVVLRIQRMSDPTIEAYRCTAAPVTSETWHHVDATFGPSGLVLRVDGVVAAGTSWTHLSNEISSCTTAWNLGIAGNDNPIAFGALTVQSTEGTGLPVTGIAGDVTLDDVKIWSLP